MIHFAPPAWRHRPTALIPKTLLVALLLSLLPTVAMAEAPAESGAPPKTEAQEQLDHKVDDLAGKLTEIEKRIDVEHASPGVLAGLASEVAPLVPQSQAVVDRLTPRVSAFKARLDQFGTKADVGESNATKKERETLQKQFADNDGLLKRAKALALKAQQDAAYIARRQRTLFTSSLFKRSTSILSPSLWATVVSQVPGDIEDATRVLQSWYEDFEQDLTGGKRIVFWLFVAFVVALYWPLSRIARRLVRQELKVEQPSEWQKTLVACWTAVSVAALLIAAMYGIVYLFSFVVTTDSRLAPLFQALQGGGIRLAIALSLGRALLAPYRRKWRPLAVDSASASRLMRLVLAVAGIVTILRIVQAAIEVIDGSLDVSVASRGIGMLFLALVLAAGLFGLRAEPEDGQDEPAPANSYNLAGILRGLTWALIAVIGIAVLVGYIPFASFLGEQLVRVAAVGAILYLAIRLADGTCDIALQPNSRLGRNLIYTVGLRRETLQQLAVIVSGAVRLSLIVAALMIVAAPWGMQSSDLTGNLTAIFFGFKIGDFTISIAGIIVAVGSFLLVLAASHALQRWLDERYLPTTRLDPGLRNSIKTSLGYVGFILALAIAAANLGLDFQKLAIVAGALSVGIGFGLQSIVNNFVSGLILLWERAVRVGDWVVVGSDQGYVRKINVRSTEIETFDRTSVIVPNSNLVSGIVKNLMRQDRTGRITIDLTVNSTSDPEKVREVLLDIARDNTEVVSLPSPQVRFTELTASAMNFSLFCFVSDVESLARTKSDLYFEIYKRFRQNKFFDGPAPDPTKITFVDLERMAALLRPDHSRDGGNTDLLRKTA